MTTPIAAEGDAMPKRPRQPRPAIGPVDIAAASTRINKGLWALWPKIKRKVNFYQEYGDGDPATWATVDRDNAEADAAEFFEEISGALLVALMIERAESEQLKRRGRPRKAYLAFLGPKLGTAFRGAVQKPVRRRTVHSAKTTGRKLNSEYGPFKEFLELVLSPLEELRREYFPERPAISLDALVRRAHDLPDPTGHALPSIDGDDEDDA